MSVMYKDIKITQDDSARRGTKALLITGKPRHILKAGHPWLLQKWKSVEE